MATFSDMHLRGAIALKGVLLFHKSAAGHQAPPPPA